MATEAKRAYDKAAEAFCDHVQDCPDCTMTGPHCQVGNDLLRAENEAWPAYRNAVALERVRLAADLSRSPREG